MSNEVPPIDSKASGTAFFTVNGNSISYIISISRIDDLTRAHLHKGVEGTNGTVVVDLTGNPAQGSFNFF